MGIETVYADSNLFIFASSESSSLRPAAKAIVEKIVEGKIPCCTSSLTWDEVSYAIHKQKNPEAGLLAGSLLLKLPNLRFLSADRAVISTAQGLRSKYGLAPRDAIHAATAILAKESDFLSADPDFDVVKEFKRVSLAKFRT